MGNDKKQFTTIMKALAVNAGVDLSDDILKLYQEALKEFTIDQISIAAKKILLTWEYNRMPPLAVIIKHIKPVPRVEDKALTEANNIIVHLKVHGATKYPDISDPITKHLMAQRWPYRNWAATILESEIKWWVKEFCEAYISYRKIDIAPQIGSSERMKQLITGIAKEV